MKVEELEGEGHMSFSQEQLLCVLSLSHQPRLPAQGAVPPVIQTTLPTSVNTQKHPNNVSLIVSLASQHLVLMRKPKCIK